MDEVQKKYKETNLEIKSLKEENEIIKEKMKIFKMKYMNKWESR